MAVHVADDSGAVVIEIAGPDYRIARHGPVTGTPRKRVPLGQRFDQPGQPLGV